MKRYRAFGQRNLENFPLALQARYTSAVSLFIHYISMFVQDDLFGHERLWIDASLVLRPPPAKVRVVLAAFPTLLACLVGRPALVEELQDFEADALWHR